MNWDPAFVAQLGGIFALLTFAHFVVDWGFQTHYEAMNKATNRWVRAHHCAIYTMGFVPIIIGFNQSLYWWEAALALNILFWSHYFEDTYVLVYLWAKHARRIPSVRLDGIEAFKAEFQRPLGLVLFIVIDQIIHLTFLWPIAYMFLTK